MKIGELFAGYGGLGMGVKAVLGGEVAWVSEIDKGACKVLAHRYPDAPNLGDITAVDWSQVERVDVLTGGFPCQDVSTAGKRAGLKPGTRSGLWEHFAYAIDQLRPSLVVIENVRGLLSAEAHSDVEPCPWCVGDDSAGALRALGAVLGDLADLGYDAAWCGLRAADVGAAHGRFRVFIVAYPRGGSFAWIATAGDGLPVAAERGLCACGWAEYEHDPAEHRPALTLLPTPAVNDMGAGKTPAVNDMGRGKTPGAWDEWTDAMKAKHGNGNGHGPSLDIEVQRLLPTPVVTDAAGTRNESSGRGPDARPHHTGTTLGDVTYNVAFGDYAAAISRHEAAFGYPAPDPTEPAPRGGRRLSCRFDEWMMGLPPGWITDVPGVTHNEALRMCGNGVVPRQAAAALRWLLTVERAA